VTGAVRAVGDGASGEDLVTLDTPRLILRQWQPTDLDRYVELFADPEVARYIFHGRPARREQVSEMSGNYLRQWRDLRLGPFAAIDKATGAWASRHVMEKLGLTYRGTHVIADAEIVWHAIDNTG
jgi:hypothetical protein